MSYLYISEFSRMGVDHGGLQSGAPVVPSLQDHRIEIGALPNRSPSFREQTRVVMVHATHACCLGFGKDADQTLHRMGAGETRFYGVNPELWISVVMAEE